MRKKGTRKQRAVSGPERRALLLLCAVFCMIAVGGSAAKILGNENIEIIARADKPCFVDIVSLGIVDINDREAVRKLPHKAQKAAGKDIACGKRVDMRENNGNLDGMSGHKLIMLGMKIDINSADKEDLVAVPNIGEVRSDMILGLREMNGNFESFEDMKILKGFNSIEWEKYFSIHKKEVRKK